MLQTIMLAATIVVGQYRQCQTATTFHTSTVGYNYVQPQQYVEKVLFLPVEHQDPYFASIVHDKLRQEERAKENFQAESNLAAQVGKLSEAVGSLEKRFQQLLGTASPLSPNDATPSKPSPEPPPTPTPTPANDTLTKEVTAIFTKNCAKCHTGETSAGDFVMFDDNEKMRDFLPLEKVSIDQEIYSGNMPRNAKPLDEATYSKIRAWIDLSRKDIISALANCKKKGE